MIHVAVGVVLNSKKEVLVALRPKHVDQGDLWEFPGGKVEPGETPLQALVRELAEEVGITVATAEPLLKITHQYPEKQVLLDVWQVTEYSGEAKACAGQSCVRWVDMETLLHLAIPVANHPIVMALMHQKST